MGGISNPFFSKLLTPKYSSLLVLSQFLYLLSWDFEHLSLNQRFSKFVYNFEGYKPPPPPNNPSLKSRQGTVLSDSHIKTPYPSSSGGGLFGHRNKQHPFKSKGLSKCHPIIVKPLTIWIPQSYTIQHFHYSPWGDF